MNSLLTEDPDSYSKENIDKFNQYLKKANNHFDERLDGLINLFIEAKDRLASTNKDRYHHLKKRMNYIEYHTAQEIEEILKKKCEPLLARNLEEQEELMKASTKYVESHDEKEN